MLKVVVHPCLELFARVHEARLRAKDRIRLIQDLIFEGNPFWPGFLSEMAKVPERGFAPAESVGADSYYAVRGHQVWGAMNPLNSAELQLENIEKLLAIDWEALVEEAVQDFPWPLSGEVELFIVPGDPHNPYLMVFERGLSILSLVPGKILVAIWPHAETLARLRAQMPGEILVNQYLKKKPLTAASTLLDHWLVLSLRKIGLHGFPEFKSSFETDLCAALKVEQFADIPCNIFGPVGTFQDFQFPNPPPPSPDMVQLYLDLYRESTAPGTIAAFLYGDPYLQKAGYSPEGFQQNFGSKEGGRLLQPHLGLDIEALRF